MKAFFIPILLVLFFTSCQPENSELDDEKDVLNNTKIDDTDVNNLYNQLGLFIVGKESTQFKTLQTRDYYLNYKQKLDETWNQTTVGNLRSIENWQKENNILFNDSLPLLYPFSGPDFLYANAFFPNATKHIMIGLENPGKLPNFNKMDDNQVSVYLYKLYHSLRYINQNGYFTTSQMQSDFKDSSMNGIIHILLFYLVKTGHQISKINYLQIDNFGHEKEKKNFELGSEFVNGLKIIFYSTKTQQIKTLYYFPFDLADENIKDNFGFVSFISGFGLKNTYMKSASYLLHNPDFKIIQDLILKQSDKILQDDSGIPYEKLINSSFSVQLFGNYTQTTKSFEKYYQPSLKDALIEKKSNKLPFKLGYNSLKNEMVLMLAFSNGGEINKPITYKTEKDGVVFKVQIKSSWKKIPLNSPIFKGLPKVDFYYTDNLYKYTIGSFSNAEACEEYRIIAAQKGYKDAFVVAFYQKNRISLEDAERMLKGE